MGGHVWISAHRLTQLRFAGTTTRLPNFSLGQDEESPELVDEVTISDETMRQNNCKHVWEEIPPFNDTPWIIFGSITGFAAGASFLRTAQPTVYTPHHGEIEKCRLCNYSSAEGAKCECPECVWGIPTAQTTGNRYTLTGVCLHTKREKHVTSADYAKRTAGPENRHRQLEKSYQEVQTPHPRQSANITIFSQASGFLCCSVKAVIKSPKNSTKGSGSIFPNPKKHT